MPNSPLTTAPLSGYDGNVFAVMSRATRALKRSGFRTEADELVSRVFETGSYDEALTVICEYVSDGDDDAAE